MDIVVALISLAIVVIVAVYVAQPLVVWRRVKASADELPRDKLLAERAALYTTIHDLDFDFQTGKLLEADYRAMREKHMARGVEILKELDAMPDLGWRSEVRGRKSEVADEIEAAVQMRRKAKSRSAQATSVEDEVEAAIRARRQWVNRNPKSEIQNQTCPSCGHPVDPTDRFCAKCGEALAVEATR